jgi:low temperature requirement protein LtrA
MVAGIVFFAFAVETTLAHAGSRLQSPAAVALCGGVALYFLALSAFERSTGGSFNRPRLLGAATLALLAPAAMRLPSLVSLALVAAVAVGVAGSGELRPSLRSVIRQAISPIDHPRQNRSTP